MEPTSVVIACLTFGIFLVAALQYKTFSRTPTKTNLAVQRAYVDMSHTSPPGLELQLDGPNPHMAVTIAVKNHGRTPARVV